jgi:hypothetical protein
VRRAPYTDFILRAPLRFRPHLLALALASLAGAGCEEHQEHRPIPNGTYLPGSGNERIAVRGKGLSFSINVSREGKTRSVSRSFESYFVHPDGSIQPYPMRAIDNTYGVGSFRWYWQGGAIVQRERESGKVLERFQQRPAPGRAAPEPRPSASVAP